MNMSDIKKQVMRGNFTTSDLQSRISYTRTVMETQTKASLSVGDHVFVVQKTKRTPGVVTKIARTKAVVKMSQGNYRVPLAMIEVA